MLNEIEEFNAYTGTVNYSVTKKCDTSYLSRFTYDMLIKLEGFARVLTIVARGYMFKNGTVAQIDYARRALCAWCSIPDNKKNSSKKDWQYTTDYNNLHHEFPELVDNHGCGWFYNHIHNVITFVQSNPDKVMKAALSNCEKLNKGFDREWRKKVQQLQIPLFSPNTKGAWVLRFDDILADALESGPIKNKEIPLPPELMQKITELTPKGVPAIVIPTLVQYYLANRQNDTNYVVLPVTNFNAYFGTSQFDKKWLPKIPTELIERSSSGYGISRYKLNLQI